MTPTQRYASAYLATVAAMHAIDGPWKQWTKGTTIDMWTLTHVGWSMIGRAMGVPLRTVMHLAVVNEAAEFVVRETRPDLLWGTPEHVSNVIMDLVANYAGYHVPIPAPAK